MDLPNPPSPRQPFEVLRDERSEQQGRQPVLGDAVRDVQPGIAKRCPVDLAILGGMAEWVDEPVDIELPWGRPAQSFRRWTGSSPAANRARSSFLSNFPTVVLGTSVMNVQFSGTCQRATLASR